MFHVVRYNCVCMYVRNMHIHSIYVHIDIYVLKAICLSIPIFPYHTFYSVVSTYINRRDTCMNPKLCSLALSSSFLKSLGAVIFAQVPNVHLWQLKWPIQGTVRRISKINLQIQSNSNVV